MDPQRPSFKATSAFHLWSLPLTTGIQFINFIWQRGEEKNGAVYVLRGTASQSVSWRPATRALWGGHLETPILG